MTGARFIDSVATRRAGAEGPKPVGCGLVFRERPELCDAATRDVENVYLVRGILVLAHPGGGLVDGDHVPVVPKERSGVESQRSFASRSKIVHGVKDRRYALEGSGKRVATCHVPDNLPIQER